MGRSGSVCLRGASSNVVTGVSAFSLTYPLGHPWPVLCLAVDHVSWLDSAGYRRHLCRDRVRNVLGRDLGVANEIDLLLMQADQTKPIANLLAFCLSRHFAIGSSMAWDDGDEVNDYVRHRAAPPRPDQAAERDDQALHAGRTDHAFHAACDDEVGGEAVGEADTEAKSDGHGRSGAGSRVVDETADYEFGDDECADGGGSDSDAS